MAEYLVMQKCGFCNGSGTVATSPSGSAECTQCNGAGYIQFGTIPDLLDKLNDLDDKLDDILEKLNTP